VAVTARYLDSQRLRLGIVVPSPTAAPNRSQPPGSGASLARP